MTNLSIEKVYPILVYSLEKVYFWTRTNLEYDAKKKN